MREHGFTNKLQVELVDGLPSECNSFDIEDAKLILDDFSSIMLFQVSDDAYKLQVNIDDIIDAVGIVNNDEGRSKDNLVEGVEYMSDQYIKVFFKIA